MRVLGVWTGPEFDSFVTVKSQWESTTGGVVDWQATRDVAESLASDTGGGDAPDIAVIPNVAVVQQLARDGRLVPLDSFLDKARLAADYAPAWRDLGSHDGKLYGIFYKVTDKATVWYSPMPSRPRTTKSRRRGPQ